MPHLSRREQQVARLVSEGLRNREIAALMGVTEHTVKNYLCTMFRKLAVSSRIQLMRRYLDLDLKGDPQFYGS
jgi:two-component system nitrate/nitrite response regulator NarP